MTSFTTGEIIGYRAVPSTVPSAVLRCLNLNRQAPLAMIIGSAAPLNHYLRERTFCFARHLNGIASQTGMITVAAGVRTELLGQFGRARVSDAVNTALLAFAPEMTVDLGCPFTCSDSTRVPLPQISHLVMLSTYTGKAPERDYDLRENEYWEANTKFMFKTVAEMIKTNKPYAAFVIGGGERSALETLEALELGIPVISIYDSGRFAADLGTAFRDGIEDDMTGVETMEKILRHEDLIHIEQFGSMSLFATIREIYGL